MDWGDVTADLRKIYQDAKDEGIWLREFIGDPGKSFVAFAGTMAKAEVLEAKLGKELDLAQLTFADLVESEELDAHAGGGITREEACRKAIEDLKLALAQAPQRKMARKKRKRRSRRASP